MIMDSEDIIYDDKFTINALTNNKIVEIYEFIATLINIRKLELRLPFQCIYLNIEDEEILDSTSLSY